MRSRIAVTIPEATATQLAAVASLASAVAAAAGTCWPGASPGWPRAGGDLAGHGLDPGGPRLPAPDGGGRAGAGASCGLDRARPGELDRGDAPPLTPGAPVPAVDRSPRLGPRPEPAAPVIPRAVSSGASGRGRAPGGGRPARTGRGSGPVGSGPSTVVREVVEEGGEGLGRCQSVRARQGHEARPDPAALDHAGEHRGWGRWPALPGAGGRRGRPAGAGPGIQADSRASGMLRASCSPASRGGCPSPDLPGALEHRGSLEVGAEPVAERGQGVELVAAKVRTASSPAGARAVRRPPRR